MKRSNRNLGGLFDSGVAYLELLSTVTQTMNLYTAIL